jgi:uncharacterized protein
MKASAKSCLLFIAVLLCFGRGLAQPKSPLAGGVPDRPGTFLYDPTNLLSSVEQSNLNARLIAFRDSTSNELAVLILRRVPEGEVMESFVNEVFNRWGIGDKEKSNGVLLAVFVDDRKMRIEVGYGLESVLTDGITGRIQRETLRPAFRDQAYAQGINTAIDQLAAAARGEFGATPADETLDEGIFWPFLVFGGVFGLFFLWVAVSFLRGLYIFVRLMIRRLRKLPDDGYGLRYDKYFFSGNSSGGSSGGRSSGSSSSSSFGGGSSGGGGSSSSW